MTTIPELLRDLHARMNRRLKPIRLQQCESSEACFTFPIEASWSDARKLKIAMVSDAVYPYTFGGKETRLSNVSTELARQGHEVHVFTMQWWSGPTTFEEGGITYHSICAKHEMYLDGRRSWREALLFALACLRIRAQDFDIIDVDQFPTTALLPCWIICTLHRRPLVATWHERWHIDSWQEYTGPVVGRIAYAVESILLTLPSVVVVTSDLTARRLEESAWRIKLAVIQNVAVDPSLKFFWNVEKSWDIIYVGRLMPHKNVDLLLDALAELNESRPSTSCLIVGSGPEERRLVERARKLGLERSTHFTVIHERVELMRTLGSARVFASLSDREGFGLGVAEALSCGIPVVISNSKNNFATQLVSDGINGSVVQADAAEVARALAHWLSGTSQVSSRRAPDTWQRVAQETAKLYERQLTCRAGLQKSPQTPAA